MLTDNVTSKARYTSAHGASRGSSRPPLRSSISCACTCAGSATHPGWCGRSRRCRGRSWPRSCGSRLDAGSAGRSRLSTVGADVAIEEAIGVRAPVVTTPAIRMQSGDRLNVGCSGGPNTSWSSLAMRFLLIDPGIGTAPKPDAGPSVGQVPQVALDGSCDCSGNVLGLHGLSPPRKPRCSVGKGLTSGSGGSERDSKRAPSPRRSPAGSGSVGTVTVGMGSSRVQLGLSWTIPPSLPDSHQRIGGPH